MSNDAYINELSLQGQYESIEDFLESNSEFVYVIGWLEKRNYKLLKRYDLYESMITSSYNMLSLSGYRPVNAGKNNDLLRRLKMDFLRMCNVEPFWQPDENDVICSLGDIDITGSSVARASVKDGLLLSFDKDDDYTDKELCIDVGGTYIKEVFSINKCRLLAEALFTKGKLNRDEYLKLRYRNTRLNFSKLQEEYGTKQLQKDEFDDCIKSFDKFISYDKWNDMLEDKSLKYKAYQPSSKKDNWFAGTEYSKMSIDKFRCVNPKRCYGFREGDTFYVLRIERDHKVSDNG